MKCPHCEYTHIPCDSWDNDTKEFGESAKGALNGFYELHKKLHRMRDNEFYNDSQPTVSLYACPSCMKTFVE